MTEQEAINEFKERLAIPDYKQSIPKYYEAMEMAVKALEKQIEKKPIAYNDTNRADCPICGATVRGIDKPFGDWCSKCGNGLDWGNEDD